MTVGKQNDCGLSNLCRQDPAKVKVTRIVMDSISDAGSTLVEPPRLAAAQLVRVRCSTDNLPAQRLLWRQVAAVRQRPRLEIFSLQAHSVWSWGEPRPQLDSLWDDLASLGSSSCEAVVDLKEVHLPEWPDSKVGSCFVLLPQVWSSVPSATPACCQRFSLHIWQYLVST